ncbi:HPP family protein [Porphyrobacter sp. AAP82]|uniref:HPP family protein n=1 Tax=Porphyrobacter sp. AAP82 TaxID=1248917 RepID=UPI00030C1C4E|nr:HPP family protein [Porphyrobacter sp. AAP82]
MKPDAPFRHAAALLPQRVLGQLGWLRGSFGAGLGIAVAGLVTTVLLGNRMPGLPWLVAPLGASAVLVFAVPASPLAQPWSVVGGNLISASIGLALGLLVGEPAPAAALAVGLAIATMSLARCLHPPGGACALLCALGAAGPEGWGYCHLAPIIANVLALAACGWIYNNATGHRWPHVVAPVAPGADRVHPSALHTREDIEATLAGWDELLDVDVDELDAFCRAVSERVAGRARKNGAG